jgi:hypothetical protein
MAVGGQVDFVIELVLEVEAFEFEFLEFLVRCLFEFALDLADLHVELVVFLRHAAKVFAFLFETEDYVAVLREFNE